MPEADVSKDAKVVPSLICLQGSAVIRGIMSTALRCKMERCFPTCMLGREDSKRVLNFQHKPGLYVCSVSLRPDMATSYCLPLLPFLLKVPFTGHAEQAAPTSPEEGAQSGSKHCRSARPEGHKIVIS